MRPAPALPEWRTSAGSCRCARATRCACASPCWRRACCRASRTSAWCGTSGRCSTRRTSRSCTWRATACSCGGTPPEHAVALHVHDLLVLLVEHLPLVPHQADVRLALQHARLQHGEAHAQRVARAHRQDPADVLHSGRAGAGRIEQVCVAHHPHGEPAGLPAAGDQPAEHGLLRCLLVDVERLRIVLAREADDVLLRQRLSAELARRAGGEVFPVVFELLHAKRPHPSKDSFGFTGGTTAKTPLARRMRLLPTTR